MDKTPVAGFDPDFVHGGDGSHVMFGFHGDNIHKVRILEATEHVLITEDRMNKKEDRHFQIAKKLRKECEARGVTPENLAYDRTGAGEPWGAILAEVWSPRCLGVMFGGSASERTVGLLDRKPANELFADRVSELWGVARDYLRSGQLFGLNGQIAQELAARRYEEIKRGDHRLIEVESKKEMRDRMAGKSPNLADAFCIMLELCRVRYAFRANVAKVVNEHQRQLWRQHVQKQEVIANTVPQLVTPGSGEQPIIRRTWAEKLRPIEGEGWGTKTLIR